MDTEINANMKLIDYYILTKQTSKSCLKISGAIFTAICFIITFISGTKNHNPIDYLSFFLICTLLGNGFGLFILIVAFLSGYFKTKAIFKLYNSIPALIRHDMSLNLGYNNLNSKYNFLEAFIYCDMYDLTIYIEKSVDKNKIRIIALSYNNNSTNFQNKIQEIEKKYIKSGITLTGLGFCKEIARKEWKKWDITNFESAFSELIQVTNEENDVPNSNG